MAAFSPRKLAAILHADVVGSTLLVQRNETLAHVRIRDVFRRFWELIQTYGGTEHELRGDALVAVFQRASDAVCAAARFQEENTALNTTLGDDIRPVLRVGISVGEVVVADKTITGEGVVLAQRLEQIAPAGGVCIQGAAFETVPKRFPFDYESLGEQTLKGFEAPVRTYIVSLRSGERVPEPESEIETESAPPAPPAKPSIAVLAFTNMSGDSEQEYFSDGITEDIITALAKNRWLSVIARNSVFSYKDRSVDIREVAKELDADYVVEGSVRKVGNRVRVTAQLIDATSRKHLWAEHYDGDLEDIFALQDEITGTIAATIEPELGSVEQQRAYRKSPRNLSAWDCYHLGLHHMYRFSKEGNAEARRLFQRVIELDPSFSSAYARLAYCTIINMVYFDAEPEREDLDEALEAAKKAVSLDDRDAVGHFALGRVYLARQQYDAALEELETSVSLNPNLAQAHCGLGDALTYSERPDEALRHFDEAIRLSPRDPYRWGFMNYRSMSHLFRGEYEESAKWAKKALGVPIAQYVANANLVAALGYLDRPEETHAAVEELLKKKPEFSCSFAKKRLFYIKSEAQIERYMNGLRRAGIPE